MFRRYHHQPHTPFLAFLLASILVLMASSTQAMAKWKFWDKSDEPEIEVFQPPPADTLERECGPIKQDIQDIYRKNAVMRHLLIPKREYLLAKHERCKKNFADQEYKYLKHIEIANPKLDDLPEETEETTNTSNESKPE